MTIISGAPPPADEASDTTVLLWANAVLSGFTVQNGCDNEPYGAGGGVYGAGGAIVTNCILKGNSVSYYGGGAYGVTLYNCTLTGNFAPEGGGANNCTLYDCTLDGNSSDDMGGGAYNCTLHNCTLVGNSGGGAYLCSATNCIFYLNTDSENDLYSNWSGGSFSYCCTTPLPAGAGNISSDPMFTNAAGGDYHLLAGSPCIGAGIYMDWMAGTTDLDGNPRVVGGMVDMGAYEHICSCHLTNQYLFTGSETNITLCPGLYDITACGAQGGNSSECNGGLGAIMQGQFYFTT